MNYEDILYTEDNGVATITINRPERYNAFRGQTCMELIDAFNRAGWNKAIGVIVLGIHEGPERGWSDPLALAGLIVGGLALAHDRALALFRDSREAVRSQYWMLTVMVGYTCLGLWLLSAVSS